MTRQSSSTMSSGSGRRSSPPATSPVAASRISKESRKACSRTSTRTSAVTPRTCPMVKALRPALSRVRDDPLLCVPFGHDRHIKERTRPSRDIPERWPRRALRHEAVGWGTNEGMLQALRSLIAAVRERDPGVTLVQIDRWTLAEELWSFGEDSLYREALRLDDEQMIRVWLLAGRLSLHGKARSSGEAASLAAVEVIEGRRRQLTRTRRRRQADRPDFRRTPEQRYAEINRVEESESFPEMWR